MYKAKSYIDNQYDYNNNNNIVDTIIMSDFCNRRSTFKQIKSYFDTENLVVTQNLYLYFYVLYNLITNISENTNEIYNEKFYYLLYDLPKLYNVYDDTVQEIINEIFRNISNFITVNLDDNLFNKTNLIKLKILRTKMI